MSHLPDFVVLGQGKAGTSLMHRVLGENPAVCVSQPKELHFFNSSYDRGREWYARHFRPASDQVRRIGDISPSYLREEAVQRIADTLGTEIQIVFVLRRPVEQSYSRYLQNICAQGRGAGFDRVLANLPKRLDNQFRALRLCYDLFGADRILPLFYETDITTFAFEARLLGFLGLPPAEFSAPFRSGPRINSGVMPRYVYAGENPLEIREDGESYVLPARHLAFCAQPRNSRVLPDISRQAAAELMEQQAGWTREISREVYARAQEEAVLPAAARLEEAFGFDMSHWRGAPRALSYAPAPLPPVLKAGSAAPPPTEAPAQTPAKAPAKASAKAPGKASAKAPALALALSGAAFRKSLHVSPRLGLVYVNNPKVACSSIKLTLQRSELDDPRYTPRGSVHTHETSPLLTWPDLAMEDARSWLEGGLVFSFVRNPYDRLRSAYLNKIVQPQKKGRFRVSAGFAPDALPAFSDFVLALADQPPERHNPHWRGQALNLSAGRISYDFIGRLECFAEDWAVLAARTGLPARAAFAGKRTEQKQKADLAFSPAAIAAVQQIYAADFDLFGYDPDPGGNRVPPHRPGPGKRPGALVR